MCTKYTLMLWWDKHIKIRKTCVIGSLLTSTSTNPHSLLPSYFHLSYASHIPSAYTVLLYIRNLRHTFVNKQCFIIASVRTVRFVVFKHYYFFFLLHLLLLQMSTHRDACILYCCSKSVFIIRLLLNNKYVAIQCVPLYGSRSNAPTNETL